MFKAKINNVLLCALSKQRKFYSKISYRHNIGKEPLRPLTIGKLLEESADKHGNRACVISRYQNRTISFKEVLNEADTLAAGLMKLGLKRGDRVGLWAPNSIEWYVTKMACARSGLIMVAINPAYQPAEIEYCINKVGIKSIICPQRVKKQDFYEVLKTFCTNLPDCEPGKLKNDKVPSLESVIVTSDDNPRGTIHYKQVLDSADPETIRSIKKNQDKIRIDEPFNIQFTSGTTGNPKAAVTSHFNIVNNSFYIGKRNGLASAHQTICVQVPFFHAFGVVITIGAQLNHGATLVIPSESYNPDASLDAIRDERCTVIHGTPTMYVDLIARQKERKEDISPVIAVAGGAPCSPSLFKAMLKELKVKEVKSVYGLTETTAVVFQSLPGDDEYKSTSTVGHIQEHIEVKVVDQENNIVPIDTPGELCIRGYCSMLEYWGDETKTRETIGSDMWLKTGDQFVLQEDGYGKIVGRLKEMIIRGGENIFPKEIEDLLNTHHDILETFVIGLPHERLGEEVCACLRTRNDITLTQKDIVQYCEGKIAHFKIPSKVKIVQEFPKTASGKIQKFKLQQEVLKSGF